MVGAWYAYFRYPEMWYYLPSLLIVTVGQLLGFILLQVYLYGYSKSRRKTTICGLCFAHVRDADQEINANSEYRTRKSRVAYDELLPSNYAHSTQDSQFSGADQVWHKRSNAGLYDPVFGEQIEQTAAPFQKRQRRKTTGSAGGKSGPPREANSLPSGLGKSSRIYRAYSRTVPENGARTNDRARSTADRHGTVTATLGQPELFEEYQQIPIDSDEERRMFNAYESQPQRRPRSRNRYQDEDQERGDTDSGEKEFIDAQIEHQYRPPNRAHQRTTEEEPQRLKPSQRGVFRPRTNPIKWNTGGTRKK